MFFLADTVGNIPIVLVLTKGIMPDQRNKVIDKAIIVAIATIIAICFCWASNSKLFGN
ncbi:MarC family protein [Nostoc sp.]|uniref:MarC family protein n=1 Tax=Nostoc sp. TaxID=1180 RepID=UPI002FFB25D9